MRLWIFALFSLATLFVSSLVHAQGAELEHESAIHPKPTPVCECPAPVAEAMSTPAPVTTRRWFPYAGLAFNSADDLNFGKINDSSHPSSTQSLDYMVARAAALDAGVFYLPPSELLGAEIGGSIEAWRTPSGLVANTNTDVTQTEALIYPTMQINLLEASMIFQAPRHLYFPLGLNYSIVQIKGGENIQLNFRGGLGAQFGLGYNVGHFHFQTLVRVIALSLEGKSGGDVVDYHTGTLTGLEFRALYAF